MLDDNTDMRFCVDETPQERAERCLAVAVSLATAALSDPAKIDFLKRRLPGIIAHVNQSPETNALPITDSAAGADILCAGECDIFFQRQFDARAVNNDTPAKISYRAQDPSLPCRIDVPVDDLYTKTDAHLVHTFLHEIGHTLIGPAVFGKETPALLHAAEHFCDVFADVCSDHYDMERYYDLSLRDTYRFHISPTPGINAIKIALSEVFNDHAATTGGGDGIHPPHIDRMYMSMVTKRLMEGAPDANNRIMSYADYVADKIGSLRDDLGYYHPAYIQAFKKNGF